MLDRDGTLARMSWRGNRISVLLPNCTERDSIRTAAADFSAIELVDEIVVINSYTVNETPDEICAAVPPLLSGTKLRQIYEPHEQYGQAVKRGLRDSSGDFIFIADCGGTFVGRDMFKLLAYVDDADVVYGSRTASSFVWANEGIGGWARWWTWAIAKLVEFLFNTSHLTDVGSTLWLLRRDVFIRLERDFTANSKSFGLETMLLSLTHGLRVIQVPVNCFPSVHTCRFAGDARDSFRLGLGMIKLVFSYWLHPQLLGRRQHRHREGARRMVI
jgi:hypothetical protein